MLWGLKPVEVKPAYGLAVERLRRQIHTGLLLPEERLPAERALATRFGISRVTLREALRILESHFYISVRRGAQGGAFVADVESLNQMARHHLSRAPAVAMRVVEFLTINQLAAVQLAAQRRNATHLARLRQALEMMCQAQNAPLWKQAETLFFLSLGDASQNTLLARAIEDGLSELFLPFEFSEKFKKRKENISLFQALLEGLEKEEAELCFHAIKGLHELMWENIRQLTRHHTI